MKKTTYTNIALTALLILFGFQAFSQNYVPFTPRFNQDVKGDIVLIGNNILGPDNNAYNDNRTYNSNVNMQYIDIDGDPSTFSSSSADLEITNQDCYKIIHAGLYWSAVAPGDQPIDQVRFKGPSGGYFDITGTVIFNGNDLPNPDSIDGGNSFPYACYADVTSIVTGLTNNLGTYTVANVSSRLGRTSSYTPRNGTGNSAGWSLYIVYEDPTVTGKSITSFDGFSAISASNNPTLDVPVSGFRTVPAPIPVRARFAFAALEGDKRITGDRLLLNGVRLSSTDRPSNNFFNSTISQLSGLPVNDRDPNSTNTLGFDTGVIEVPNAGNSIINNDDTSAIVSLSSVQDTYFPYFYALAVDIIEPKIILTKTVEDLAGNDIGGQIVNLGDELYYVLRFQNTGNDDATNLTIRDVLPNNIVFNYPADIDVLPPGVSQSYDAANRELTFTVDNSVVEENDPYQEIRFKVTVVRTCSLLNNACDNQVVNQAFATYNGTLNPSFTITDDPSYDSNASCVLDPSPTNFIADIDCSFQEEVILCGASTVLTAGGGYDSYSWSTSPTGTPVIGTSQTLTVTEPGTYYVQNTATAPCQSIDQEFEVITFGYGVTNPMLPFADQIVVCPNDGKQLPNFFLCGTGDTRLIETNITDTSSIIWEKLDETSCDAVLDLDCANENASCIWNQVATGPNFLLDTAGQYRLTLNYTGGCFNQYYFNVYTNLVEPTVAHRDIYCTTPGEIVVGGVPSGYEYSIDGVNYQASNTFSITTPGNYPVFVRQIGVSPNPCIFPGEIVQIRERDFTATTNITQPLCHGDLGSVVLGANDVRAQYYFSIFQGATEINSVGPINANTYTFSNLNPGNYTVNISTDDGCTFSQSISIIDPPLLEVDSAITAPLTCEDGEITVTPRGGTPPYYYYVNSTTEVQVPTSLPIVIPVSTAGVYNITIVDYNNCTVSTTQTIVENPAPVFTISQTDILCYGENTGAIQFNVTNANGYTLEYSIDGGTTYSSNTTFSNLGYGDYEAIVRYTLAGAECFTTAQTITITQPYEALTATAGISELAGCGPSGEGRIRITNPQGGVPPYEYSFDNQTSWGPDNDAYVLPGTYTVYIRDDNGCIYPMENIVLDQEPPAPTIAVADPVFNCDGSGNTTVTVTNNGGPSYSYNYYIDGALNPNTADPTTFLNVPSGSHTITVEYTLLTVPTFSNLLYETFGYGDDTTSPGINTTYYCFERQVAATQCNGNPRINDGDYSVTSSIRSPFGAWINPTDHTPATSPPTPDGRFLVVNIGASIPTTATLYQKQINDIIPNRPIQVEFAAMNLLRPGNTQYDPNLTVALVDALGNEISSYSTGDIPKTGDWVEYPITPVTLDPGSNTSLTFVLRSNVQQVSGNDVAIDDIRVYQLPAICTTRVDFPFVVPSGNAFTASITGTSSVNCSGSADGTITIAAENFDPITGFQYSIDGGTTWNTQLTSPYTITGLSAQNYNLLIRNEDSVDNCEFSFTPTIAEPNALSVNVTNTEVTCLDGATITATATGGTPGYTFELIDATNTVTNFPNNGVLTGVAAGTYTVRATDALGCVDATTTFTLVAPVLPTASIDPSSDFCYDAGNAATLVVNASSGQPPYQYNINGGAFGTNNTFSNLTPGTYNIIVRDSYGCEVTLPPQIIAPQIAISTIVTKELDCTASPEAIITGTVSGGTIPYTYEVSIDGAGYTSFTPAGNPFTYTAASAGTYQFRVTDDLGCEVLSEVNTVDSIEYPTATTTVIDATCFGNADGSVQIIPSDGVGPYTYSFDGSAFSATALYSGLAAGTYAYQVRDAKDCVFSGSVTVGEPTQLTATASVTAFSCDASNAPQAAVVTIDVPTTGTAPYLYSFNGSGYTATNTLTVNDNGTDQTINYSVQDANGCTAGGSLIISRLDSPTDLTFAATAVTCSVTESTVTLTPTNGVGPLTYSIISPATATGNVSGASTGVFTNLAPDTYAFRVTDANGCYYTESFTVNPVSNITVSGVKLSDVLCFGDTTGAIEFNVSNATNFTYTINGGAATAGTFPINLTGLTDGSYTIVVTDTDTGCTATETISILEPTAALALSASATNVHCNDFESDITVTATDGTPNYTYAAVVSGAGPPLAANYSANNPIAVNTNLGADLVWDVYVRDANGCIALTTVTIAEDALPTVTVPSVPSNQCTVASGFTFTATGTGVAPLEYSINGGASYQSSPTFTVNAPGTYTVTIRDGNGCTATSATDVEVFAPLTASALLTQDLTCFPTPDASIDITVSGGNAPYSYEVSSDGGVTYTSITGSPFTTTIAGTYQFLITDANSCTIVTDPIVVNTPVNPSITAVAVSQAINCNAEETGALDITIDTTQGEAPFVINVNNDTTGTNYGTQTTGLAAGDYTITVTDAKGCIDTTTITITEPDPINFNLTNVEITCNNPGGSDLGSITVENVTGGTGPFTYYISNNFGDVIAGNPHNAPTGGDHTFTIIDYGIYTVNVVDANGCSLSQQITMASPPSDLDIVVTPTVVDCASGGTVTVEAISLLGSGNYAFGILEFNSAPYTTTWFGPDTPGGNIYTFTNLTPGVVYTFVVHDITTDCYFVKSADVAIPPASPLTSSVTANNVECQGENNGSVTFTIDNFDSTTTSVDYQIFRAFSNQPVGAIGTTPVTFGTPVTITTPSPGTLAPGQYYVQFTETGTGIYNGCESASVIFEITESARPLNLTASVVSNENCSALGVISAVASDGTGPYQYQILPDTDPAPTATSGGWGTSNTFNRSAGNYIVYALDAYACVAPSAAVTLTRDADPTIDPVPQQCFTGAPINITLTGTTFSPTGVTYSIGGAYQASPNFTITAAGTYSVSIRDANGCTATVPFVVEPPLLLDAVLDADLTCGAPATITLNPSGGTGTYTIYEESSDGGANYALLAGPTFNTTTAGTYIFRVTDSQGCQAVSNEIVVTPNTSPTLTHVQTNVSCNGGSDGSITLTPANGIAPYEFSIDGGATYQSSNVFSGLGAGTYNFIVRDAKNCTGTLAVTITEPPVLGGTGVLTQGLTCGAGNATQPALITITATGGTAPYTFSFDGVNYTSTNTYATTVAGTVTAYVRDANGCDIAAPITVNVPALSVPTDLTFAATAVTCINTSSDVTVTTTGGVGPLVYDIIAPATATGNTTGATTGVFTGLAPDTYVFRVTDDNGCTYEESHTVAPVTNITVSGTVVADVSCSGGNDGAVDFTVGQFAGTYSYVINSGTPVIGQTNTSINITGLSVGPQTIVVTDDVTGCTDTFTVDVREPAAVALTLVDNINANCNFGAQVTVQGSGGTAPYQYAFVLDGSAPTAADYSSNNTAVLDPATSADWDVWVLDSNGCNDMIDLVIATDSLPTFTVTGSPCISATNDFSFAVNVTSGVGPYEFSIGNGFQPSPNFTVNAAGTYTVTVRDVNGCTAAATYTIDEPIDLTLDPIDPSCSDDDGVITVTGFGGTGNYAYSISPNVGITLTGNAFSGVSSNINYTVTVEDTVTGCTNTAQVTLEPATPVIFTLSGENLTCNGSSDGVITVNLPATNDEPIYTYEIISGPSTAPAQTSNIFTGLPAGTYEIQVRSGKNCTNTGNVTLSEPAAINFDPLVVSQYGCTTDNTADYATITVNNVTGGSGIYRFEFIDGGTVVQDGPSNVYTEADFTGGTYTVNVYDDRGCTATSATAVINPFISLDRLNVVVDTEITCTNLEDITVTAITTGGTPANMEYTVEDVDGTTIGGVYSSTNTTGSFTGLDVGNYIITVDNLDTGCSIQTTHYVDNPNTFDLEIDNVVDVTCYNDNNGSVDITFVDLVVSGTNPDQAGPFAYTITDALGAFVTSGTAPNAGPITISNLEGGTYTVEATLVNTPFCTVTENFTITRPPTALSVIATQASSVTCDNNQGSIQAVATGGWSNVYEFQLMLGATEMEPYSSNSFFTGLAAGTYTVNVRDSEGCIASDTVILPATPPITVSAVPNTTLLACFGDTNASIVVTASGGQGSNYSYTLNTLAPVVSNSGPQASNVFNNLGAGEYTVTVTDGFNCSTTSNVITITEPSEIQASLVVASTPTCLTEATLTLTASGGTAPYEYSTDATFTTSTSFTSSATIPNATPGVYQYYVRDANGCIANVSNEITIDPLPPLVVNLDTTNATINCFGESTGVIIATAEGGLGNYVYTLQDENGVDISPAPVQTSPGVFTNLPAGTYQVYVVSDDCVETSAQTVITQPLQPLQANPVVTNVICAGSNNGAMEIVASGGTGQIKYAISPQLNQFFETPVFENLAPSTYQAIAQDELGCFVYFSFDITEPAPIAISVTPNSIVPELCRGDLNAAFSVDVSGGVAPYSYSLNAYGGPYTAGAVGETQFSFSNLPGGNHVVYVRDANGCESELEVVLPESVYINPMATVEYGCTNNLSTNSVVVTTDASVNPADLEYALNGGPYQASNVFVNVPPGLNHTIEVRHANGCLQSTVGFDIEDYHPLVLTIEEGNMNEVVIVTSGGAGGNEFTVNGESVGNINAFYIYESGDYTVTVTDRYGCVATATGYFEYIDVCIPNYFTPNGDGNQDLWGPGCTDQYKDLTFDIFDRYGRKIVSLRAGEKWDGTYNGEELPTGDYWYVVKLNDPKDDRDFVGHFTLYR
ncbi:T9SS type B sorting domain-containing protein [Oceanihabitans sp. IOP_32]|uniref:T9SS type B sorting domain-containing protein n=1 Tax=Oceanihabitans sp. IOP_32 TaxID=2529032 RepID=UPI001293F0D6|nr:T9SS type B sorting domain-containing protein [Oceanihabitans sp. IOP_32]QFZ55715.1 T9SS type B sorting domain-containing protein [Oceanihabitans sp. IOP_32]